MKRQIVVWSQSDYGEVSITIRVNTNGLSKGEVETVLNELADCAMRSINNTSYITVPLSKVHVE